MTVINRESLLTAAPIKNMDPNKVQFRGASYGLAEVGYDIRLKQKITFYPTQYGRKKLGSNTYGEWQVFELETVVVEDEQGIATHHSGSRFTLASAIEEFDMPDYLMGIVHDKSTWARRGLSVFNTVIEPGWKGFLTLELVHHGNTPLVLPAGVGIAQVIFHRLQNLAAYEGKYQNQEDRPVEAILKG